MPTPGKTRQQALRDRKAALGLKEVRGVLTRTQDHDEVKEAALKHASRLAKRRAKTKEQP